MNLYDPSLFEPLSQEQKMHSEIMRPSLTYWSDAWRRLKHDKLALFGLIVIVMILLLAVFG
ncbi:MAG: ABC transporter permease, partial [Synergistaceae bacterium]|nr:ABC transporter permease [Synergistaceae bacterium]